MPKSALYCCRVCGLQQSEPPWGEDGDDPSFNICDCCGVEFGYEDMTVASAKDYRQQWLNNGAVWWLPAARPSDWDLEKQLQNIPAEYH